MKVLQTFALPLGYVTGWKKEQLLAPFSFVERVMRISPLRRLWRMKQGKIEEAARSARPTGSANRIAATVSAEAPVK